MGYVIITIGLMWVTFHVGHFFGYGNGLREGKRSWMQ